VGSGSMFEEPHFGSAEGASDEADYEDESDEGDDGEDELDGAALGNSGQPERAQESAIEEEDEEDEEDEEGVNRITGAVALAVLEHVTKALVDDPESVVVEMREGRGGLKFSVQVAQSDMGRLIGRKGRTAQAIRTLVRAAAATDHTDASVDIVD
jgi:uncharacterized protein